MVEIINTESDDRELTHSLTERELEIITFMRQGLTVKEIGEALSINPKTVESHILNAYSKLRVRGHVELVREAIRRNLLPESTTKIQNDPARMALFRSLSPRQGEVLIGLVDGGTSQEIGRRFGISEKTVESHASSLLAKLQVKSRIAAAMKALDAGLTTVEQIHALNRRGRKRV